MSRKLGGTPIHAGDTWKGFFRSGGLLSQRSGTVCLQEGRLDGQQLEKGVVGLPEALGTGRKEEAAMPPPPDSTPHMGAAKSLKLRGFKASRPKAPEFGSLLEAGDITVGIPAVRQLGEHLNKFVKPQTKSEKGWQLVSKQDRGVMDQLLLVGETDGDHAVRREAWKILKIFSRGTGKAAGWEERQDICGRLCDSVDKELDRAMSSDAGKRRNACKAMGEVLMQWHAACHGAWEAFRRLQGNERRQQESVRLAREERDTMHLKWEPRGAHGYFGEMGAQGAEGERQLNMWLHVPATMALPTVHQEGDWETHEELLHQLTVEIQEAENDLREAERGVDTAESKLATRHEEREKAWVMVDDMRAALAEAMQQGPNAPIQVGEGTKISRNTAPAALEELERGLWEAGAKVQEATSDVERAKTGVEESKRKAMGAEVRWGLAKNELWAAKCRAEERYEEEEEKLLSDRRQRERAEQECWRLEEGLGARKGIEGWGERGVQVLMREALARCAKDADASVRKAALRSLVTLQPPPHKACVFRGQSQVVSLLQDSALSDTIPSIRLFALSSLPLIALPSLPSTLTTALAALQDPTLKVRNAALTLLLAQTPAPPPVDSGLPVGFPTHHPDVDPVKAVCPMLRWVRVSGAGVQGAHGDYWEAWEEGGVPVYRLNDGRDCTFVLARRGQEWGIWHEKVQSQGARNGVEGDRGWEQYYVQDCDDDKDKDEGARLEPSEEREWRIGKLGAYPLPQIRWHVEGWRAGHRVFAWRERKNKRGFSEGSEWVGASVQKVDTEARRKGKKVTLFDVRVHEDGELLEGLGEELIVFDSNSGAKDDCSLWRQVTNGLVELLRDCNRDAVRIIATKGCLSLARCGDAETVRALVDVVSSGGGGDEVRVAFIECLTGVAERGNEAAVAALVARMADRCIKVRLAAMKGLVQLSPQGHDGVLRRVLGALDIWCEPAPDSTSVRLFEASDPRLRCACLDVLLALSAQSGKGADSEETDEEEEDDMEDKIERAVICRVDDCNDSVRRQALNAIASLVPKNSSRAIGRLCLRLSHPDHDVRGVAVAALCLVCDKGNRTATGVIIDSFLTHPDADIRMSALNALVRVGKQGDVEAASAVCERLMDSSLGVRRLAARALKHLAAEGDGKVAESLLSEKLRELRGRVVVLVTGPDAEKSDVAIAETPDGKAVYAYQVSEKAGGKVLWDSWTHGESEYRVLERDMRGFGVDDPDKDVREASFEALKGIMRARDAEMCRSLCVLLSSSYWDARRAAASLLGEKAPIADRVVLNMLASKLQDRVGLVRREALEASRRVAEKGDLETIWAVSGALRSARDWDTRRSAVVALDGLMVQGHTGKVNCVAYGRGGTVATAGEDGTLKIWDSNRLEQCTFVDSTDHMAELHSVAVSRRNQVACGEDACEDGRGRGCRVLVYDVRSGASLAKLVGHEMAVVCLDFDHGGGLLASCSLDQTLRVWDTTTWTCAHILRGHADMLVCCAFAPATAEWNLAGVSASPLLCSGGYDKSLRVWDVSEVSLHSWVTLAKQGADGQDGISKPAALEYARTFGLSKEEGERMLIESVRQHHAELCVQDLVPELKCILGGDEGAPRGHAAVVAGCAFAADGDTLFSCSQDSTIKIWSVRTTEMKETLRQPTMSFSLADTVSTIAVSANGGLVVSGSWDGTVKLFRVAQGRPPIVLRGHKGKISRVRMSLEGNMIASCGEDGDVRLWETETGDMAGSLRGRLDDVAACIGAVKELIPPEKGGVGEKPDPKREDLLGEQTERLHRLVLALREDREAQAEDEVMVSEMAAGQAADKGEDAGGIGALTLDPPGGIFTGSAPLAIRCAVADADVYYTIDGRDPVIPASYGGEYAETPLDVATSQKALPSGRHTHLITLTSSCYVKAIAVRPMDLPSPVARSLRFTVRCPAPSVLYDKQKHPEQRSSQTRPLHNECEVVLSSVTRGASMYFRILHNGEKVAEEDLKPAEMRRWNMGMEPLGIGLGERLACLAVVPRRGEETKGQYRERFIGTDESELTILEHGLNGCVRVSGGNERLAEKRTAVVLVTNQREEILVCQPKGLRGGCPLLDPFLWTIVKDGECALNAAENRVRDSLRIESPELILLASRDIEGAGHVDLYRCSIRVTSTKASQIAKDLNLLHAAFLPAFSLLYMSKSSVGAEELKEAAKLFLVDGINDLDALHSMDPVDAFLCKWDAGHSVKEGEGFVFNLELFSERMKEERGTLSVRVNVTPSNTVNQLCEVVRVATVTEGRDAGIPSHRMRLVSGGTDLVEKASGTSVLEDEGNGMTLFDLGALETIESGAVHARIRCPAFGRAEFVVLKEMAASGFLPKTRGAQGAKNAKRQEAFQKEDEEAEGALGEDQADGGEEQQASETRPVTDAKRAWHRMLKKKEGAQKFAEMLGREAKALEDRLSFLAAELLSSHVKGDRVCDLACTSSDIRFVGRTLGFQPDFKGRKQRTPTR